MEGIELKDKQNVIRGLPLDHRLTMEYTKQDMCAETTFPEIV